METLDKYFRNLAGAAFKKHGFASADVVSHWAEIVGPDMAKWTTPLRIRWPRPTEALGGTLVVAAAPGRSLDVQYAVPLLLERINQFLGFAAIIKIKIEADHAHVAGTDSPPAPQQAAIPPTDQRFSEISDDPLKSALARLGSAIKSVETGSPQGEQSPWPPPATSVRKAQNKDMNTMILNRRHLLLAATAFTAAPALAQDAPVDLTKLNEAPANGENPQGPDTAKVTVIEYASVSCPHCAAFQKDVYPLLKKEYIDTGKIKFLFREFPHNDAALGGFMIARCAPKDKYLALVDVLLNTQDKWLPTPLEGLKNIALQAGFTEETFTACLKNTDVAKGILAERDRANGFGITGIPYMFINGVKVDGEKTFEALKALIDPLLV